MEVNLRQNGQADVEEDYLLLDLDSVCLQADIPANASYVLSVSCCTKFSFFMNVI